MGCSQCLSKFVLFTANLLFVFLGISGLVMGVKLQMFIEESFHESSHPAPLAIIIVFAITFLLGFLGCCGACTENATMLSWYGNILLVLLTSKVVLMIIVLVYGYRQPIRELMEESFKNPGLGFHTIEAAFECCGTAGPLSYGMKPILPPSCCNLGPQLTRCTILEAYSSGCTDKVLSYLGTYGDVVVAVVVIFMVLETVAATLSKHLSSSIRDNTSGAVYARGTTPILKL